MRTQNQTAIAFRNDIRRKHIEQIFAVKRKLVNEKHEQQFTEINVQSMINLIVLIKNHQNVSQNIITLCNSLYEEHSLSKLKQTKGSQALQQFCEQLVRLLFLVVIPNQNRASFDGLETRKNCLVIISNIVADRNSTIQVLLPLIAESVSSIYGSISEYGDSIQFVEIGWLIGNILSRDMKIASNELEQPIQILLSWAQQILSFRDMELLGFLYKTLQKFYKGLDIQLKVSESSHVQHFKTNRLILLHQAIQENCTIDAGTSLVYLLKFVRSNLKYLQMCEEVTGTILLKKCIKMLSSLCQQKIMGEILKILIILVERESFRVLVYHESFPHLVSIFVNNSMGLKELALDLMIKLVQEKSQALDLLTPGNKINLQEIMKSYIRNLPNNDILMKILTFCINLIILTNNEYGKDIIACIEQNLLMKNGEIGKKAFEAVQYFNHLK